MRAARGERKSRKDTNHTGDIAMGKSDRLRLRDIVAACRLVGECRELGRDAQAWRLHMLEGLRLLTGAQVALHLHLRHRDEDDEIAEPLDAGFLDAAQRRLWGEYQRQRAHRDDPFHQQYFRDFTGAPRTRSLEMVVERGVWRRSRHYNDFVRACGLDDRITASFGLDAAPAFVAQVVVLHRAAADGPFAPRSVRLVQYFQRELRPHVSRSLTLAGIGAEYDALPPQLRRVLQCVLEGDGEKQVADRLGISRHTVNRHVQRLYGRFGVHSRGELMYRCRDMIPLFADIQRGNNVQRLEE